ncbi:Protein-lysine N-methyltransferase [Rhynchospora pubera]|uniref:Protein-lysine N-methyltransferase LUZ62_042059 n=1 Tax=Rhynchospora pubera TaxID=906938 RepID=A0AAV8FC21_9POAL|nr:Protein-lysine N-methyltransferase [Rhynchospora pubera]
MATRIEEDDDDVPALSAQTLAALREFIAEQRDREKEGTGEEGEVALVTEDWRLSQFWYDRNTAETLVEEIRFLSDCSQPPSPSPSVACISCPTLYAYLKKIEPDIPAQILEFDKRFGQYGEDYIFYDYNLPEELPLALKHSFKIIVADPPYLSKECLEKVTKTISFLAKPQDSRLLLLTGEVQKERALELLNARPCGFRPQHSNKLGNEFLLYTNYNPQGRLGGWEPTL